MSHAEPSKIGTTHTTTTDRRARREDRRKRLIRRDAAWNNDLRFALHEVATLRHFERTSA